MMKNLLLAILVLFTAMLTAQIAETPQGAGTLENPYQVANFNNLLWIGQSPGYWSLHYIQTADIDASVTTTMNSGAGWVPLGNGSTFFTGSYDGQGYEIQGLYLSRTGIYYTGLFGYVNGARFNRIHLRNLDIRGQIYAGGLAGVVTGGSVNNCSSTGSVNGMLCVGGLIGFANHNVVITNSYSHVAVQGSQLTGGLTGQNGLNNAYYYNCYSTGLVTCTDPNSRGGLIGSSGGGTAKYCYWDTQSSGMPTSALGTPKTTAQMKQQATFEHWNFSTQWSILEGVSYPNLSLLAGWGTPQSITLGALNGTGTMEDPYLISSPAELNAIRLAPEAWFRLTADLDLSSSVVWNLGQGWQPVGTSPAPFTGGLDGDGHSIRNLVINLPQSDYNGIFAYTQNATIKDLKLIDARIMGKNYSAALIADGMGGTLNDISVSGKIFAANTSAGLCGRITNTIMTRCQADIVIPFAGDNVGALVGVLSSSGAIAGTISECFSTGDINAGWNIGGLVGILAWGYINDCYSHAAVLGGRNIGGLVGVVGGSNPGYVSRCYATGEIMLTPGGSFSGGVIGYLSSGSQAYNSYWDIDTTGIPNDILANGRTHTQMIYPGSVVTFAAWDFGAIWRHDIPGYNNNGYPYLAWQEQAFPGAVQDLAISNVGAVIQLSWTPVAGIGLYKVYASEDPYLPYSQWAYFGTTNSTEFSTAAAGKLFFIVRAVQ